MEAAPAAAGSIASNGAVPILCAKLLSIEYIDLAEQAIQCLEKISYEHSVSILRAGGLAAVLTFIDFFPIATQRICVNIAANICRQVPSDCYPMVLDMLPNISNLLQNDDQKVVERGVVCFARLAESFYGNNENLTKLSSHGVLPHLMRIASMSPSSGINSATYTLALRLITTLCVGNPNLSISLLEGGIGAILQAALMGSNEKENNPTDPTSTTTRSISTEQLYEILNLVSELMPPLPKEMGLFISSYGLRASRDMANQRIQRDENDDEERSDDENENLLTNPETQETTTSPVQDPREKAIRENSVLLENLGDSILPLLLQVFSATINSSLRYKCLTAVTKLLHFSSPSNLKSLLKSLSVSSFIANILASTDYVVVATALKLAEILMQKLPEIFSIYFKREGVLFEVQRLSQETQNSRADMTTSAENFLSAQGELPSPAKMQQWVKEHSKKLLTDYFGKMADSEDSEELKRLKAISQDLNTLNLNSTSEVEMTSKLDQLVAVLSSPEGVSTFEFVESQLVENLLKFLTQVEFQVENSQDSHLTKEKILLERVGIFCKIFFKLNVPMGNQDSTRNQHEALQVLIHKLHHTLNKAERFSVQLNEINGTAIGLKYLTQPFKLNVQLSTSTSTSTPEKLVLIEPLAKIQSLLDYIQNLQRSEKSEKLEDSENSESSENSEIRITINGEFVPPENYGTIFQVLQFLKSQDGNSDQPQPIHRLWETTHTVTYDVVQVEVPTGSQDQVEVQTGIWEPPYIQMVSETLGFKLNCPPLIHKVMSLLRILHELNWMWTSFNSTEKQTPTAPHRYLLNPSEFVNNKLTAKMMRQLQDPMTLCSGSVPPWSRAIVDFAPFLLPFECRRLFFCCSSFGIARALQSVQTHIMGPSGNRSHDLRLGRIQRQKVRVSRQQILPSAIKAMEICGKSRAVLEVEYFAEVGTGLGPTLEFYTLVSKAIQQKDQKMWLDFKLKVENSGNQVEYVYAPYGLFPRLSRSSDTQEHQKLVDMFKFLGTFVGKALLDNRLMDLPLSPAFLKWIRGRRLTFSDLKYIDPDMGSQLEKLSTICRQKRDIENDSKLNDAEKKKKISELKIGKGSIEDLDLDFTLPGFSTWELGKRLPPSTRNTKPI
eukprot:TRINITY_DN5305_c3_g1_i1.p1 TRINITY_DN5305_c3_g1~~TRINITY_DN5305_c3_g1_i1.p1  ORF type:complete len:1262 (+),score=491.54 TRINITY_DN5305_c3_g1_i1:429-3788(+)